MAYLIDGTSTPTIVNCSVARTREYPTGKEVEKLIEAARKSSRYGHRDATMILILAPWAACFGVCDLQWHQVQDQFRRVRRSKCGTPGVHPIRGDELRALRHLQREQAPGPYVFASERGGPIAPRSFHTLISRLMERARMALPIHPDTLRHDCGYALASAGHTFLADTGLIRRHAGRRISARSDTIRASLPWRAI